MKLNIVLAMFCVLSVPMFALDVVKDQVPKVKEVHKKICSISSKEDVDKTHDYITHQIRIMGMSSMHLDMGLPSVGMPIHHAFELIRILTYSHWVNILRNN